MDLDFLHRTAIAAAYKGARVLQSKFGNIHDIREKDAREIVTEADTESEKAIVAVIRDRFPNHEILGEECGLQSGASQYRWIIDPLDGTVNFAHQVPIFCISIAVARQQETIAGIVLNPLNGELFTALRGQGVRLNGKAIQVSAIQAVDDSLLVTGFPYDIREVFEPVIARYARCLKAARGMRRLGSAALDLCYVACGRFEGFWEQNLKPWDTAAGALIVAEAGGLVTTFSNQPFAVELKEILATNGRIHEEMVGLLELIT
jgi:myo-inositol-1(or 4)-monophosphatase